MVEQCDKQLILHSSQVNRVTFLFNSAVGFIYGKIFIVPHPEHLTYHTHPSALARLPTSAKRLHRQEKPAPTGCCRLGSAKAQRRGKVDKTPATRSATFRQYFKGSMQQKTSFAQKSRAARNRVQPCLKILTPAFLQPHCLYDLQKQSCPCKPVLVVAVVVQRQPLQ